jgi:hypothetical protein
LATLFQSSVTGCATVAPFAGETSVGATGTGGGVSVRLAVRVTPSVPVIATVVFADTALVFTAKVAVVAPAATVTLAGTVAAALLLDRVTAAPPAGATPLNVTVPVEALPLTTLVGLSESAESVTDAVGVTVRAADLRTPPKVAGIVAVAEAVTDVVATVTLAVVAPAGTVTLAGTVAAAWLLDSVTAAPPDGAAPLNVTVAVEELPPTTLVGLSDSAESVRGGGIPVGVTVNVAVPRTPP